MKKESIKQTRQRWAALAGVPGMLAMALLPASVAARGMRVAPARGVRASVPAPGSMQESKPDDLGATTYQNQCSICHQADRKGVPPTFPSLVGVTGRLTDAQIADIVHNGRGRMPAQPSLEPASVTAVIAYLKSSDAATPAESAPKPPGNPPSNDPPSGDPASQPKP